MSRTANSSSTPKGGDLRRPPRISVVMAVYNGERYLREAIDSILLQTCPDFEFIIIDDGSTDRSGEIIRSYADARIRLVQNEQNLGLTRSLNSGITIARGEFIARQDADDISEPERFERQLQFMDSHPAVALLGTQYRYIDAQGHPSPAKALPCSDTDLSWGLLFGTPVIHSAVMLRREMVLERIGLYEEAVTYAQDYEYWHRISEQLEIATLNMPLVRYRYHDSQMTAHLSATASEVPRLRARIHAGMLGWNEYDGVDVMAQSAAMAALMAGWADDYEIEKLESAAYKILDLQTAFCEQQRLCVGAAKNHQEQVRAILSTHLALIAASRSIKRPSESLRLWRLARRIHASAPLQPRQIAKYCGRVAGSAGLRIHVLDRARTPA